jgi:hypothetical protein
MKSKSYEFGKIKNGRFFFPEIRLDITTNFDEKEERSYGRYLITLYITKKDSHYVIQKSSVFGITVNGGKFCCPFLNGA